MNFHAEDAHRLPMPTAATTSNLTEMGWWVLADDITEYNRENEPRGMRAVINSGQGNDGTPFAYFELQHNMHLISGGIYSDKTWHPKERCPLEFFVMRGYFATDGQWVTRYLKAFVIGLPSPFNWNQCEEPEEYTHRAPGTVSMVISENDRPIIVNKMGHGFENGV